MFLINKKNKNKKAIPILHKCEPFDIGRPMTEEDLHRFAVDLILVYYFKQGGDIKSVNKNPGIEYPHIIMANKANNKLYYLTIKADYKSIVPEPLPEENYSSLIELAQEAKAEPVFIGVVFDHIPKNNQSEVLCGDHFIVRYTGLISIYD